MFSQVPSCGQRIDTLDNSPKWFVQMMLMDSPFCTFLYKTEMLDYR